jgi:hypothetical protein
LVDAVKVSSFLQPIGTFQWSVGANEWHNFTDGFTLTVPQYKVVGFRTIVYAPVPGQPVPPPFIPTWFDVAEDELYVGDQTWIQFSKPGTKVLKATPQPGQQQNLIIEVQDAIE